MHWALLQLLSEVRCIVGYWAVRIHHICCILGKIVCIWGVILSLCTQNWNSTDAVSQVHEDASRDEYKGWETAEITRWRHFLWSDSHVGSPDRCLTPAIVPPCLKYREYMRILTNLCHKLSHDCRRVSSPSFCRRWRPRIDCRCREKVSAPAPAGHRSCASSGSSAWIYAGTPT